MQAMSKSSTIATDRRKPRGNLLALVAPGEILLEEFLKPLDLSQNALGRAIGVPPRLGGHRAHGRLNKLDV
jgi:antitoxin HigA-1